MAEKQISVHFVFKALITGRRKKKRVNDKNSSSCFGGPHVIGGSEEKTRCFAFVGVFDAVDGMFVRYFVVDLVVQFFLLFDGLSHILSGLV